MEENLLSIPPDFKLYKDRAIFTGTFLGGPLAAGYFAAENFKRLGEQSKAKTAWLIAILATVVIFGALFLVPDVEKVPRYIIPLLYSAIAQYLVQKSQGAAIKEHMEKGGQTYSSWRAAGIGLVIAAIMVAIIVGVLLMIDKDVFTTD